MDTVIYHADCADGFGAALAAWLKLGAEARYIPAKYGEPRPSIYAGDRVYVLDFSYSRAELDAMAEQASEVIVLDHHKTADDTLVTPAQVQARCAEIALQVMLTGKVA